MVIVYSATKGLAAMALAITHSRGWLDYDERVSAYWPEFAQQGKERITVRQLLAHQAGLFALDEPVDRDSSPTSTGWRSCWRGRGRRGSPEPGRHITRSRSVITRTSCCAGSIRSTAVSDSSSRTRSRRHWASTSTSAFPSTSRTPVWRRSRAARPSRCCAVFHFVSRSSALNPRSNIVSRAREDPGLPHDDERIYARNLEVPSGGGVGTARAIARAYGVFATGGQELGLRPETLARLAGRRSPTHGFHDECLKGEVEFSLGFMKPSATGGLAAEHLWISRRRWFPGICRSADRHRLRLRDESNGHQSDRRSS